MTDYPPLRPKLVHHPVDVIVASGGSISALAAQTATNTIPIVFLSGGDPCAKNGLAASFSHPGGNATGVAQLVTAVEEKSFELLRELLPTIDTIADIQKTQQIPTHLRQRTI